MRTHLAGALAAAALLIGSTSLAEAAACDDALARFQRILNQDKKLGRVDKEVYDAAMAGMVPVAATCKAGRDAQAITQLNAIKKKHGYPL
jgi:hypothetical protein